MAISAAMKEALLKKYIASVSQGSAKVLDMTSGAVPGTLADVAKISKKFYAPGGKYEEAIRRLDIPSGLQRKTYKEAVDQLSRGALARYKFVPSGKGKSLLWKLKNLLPFLNENVTGTRRVPANLFRATGALTPEAKSMMLTEMLQGTKHVQRGGRGKVLIGSGMQLPVSDVQKLLDRISPVPTLGKKADSPFSGLGLDSTSASAKEVSSGVMKSQTDLEDAVKALDVLTPEKPKKSKTPVTDKLRDLFGKSSPKSDLRKLAEFPGLLPFNMLGGLAAGAQGLGTAAGSTGKMLQDVGEGVKYLHEQATDVLGKPVAEATGLDPVAAPALGLLALGVGGAGAAALAKGLLGQAGKSAAKLGVGILKAPFQAAAYPFKQNQRARALASLRTALR